MIGIQLRGRLGNQMFQYAAARSLADRLGCRLLVAGHTLARRFGLCGHWLGLDQKPPHNDTQQNGVLRNAFGVGSGFHSGRTLELMSPALRRRFFSRSFSPRRVAVGNENKEAYDDRFHDLTSGTWLSGWFQSENYFVLNADHVRDWYRPLPTDVRKIQSLIAEWPAAPEAMAAVHVRRGDYASIRDGIGHAENGWLLPTEYYQRALQEIPREVPLAIFSDDPDWAAHAFVNRRAWVSRGNRAVVDMLLMSRCRWNVTANSSFSWWAAWLNSHLDKVVLAPRHHLGWMVGQWVPDGIQVDGWRYFDVPA